MNQPSSPTLSPVRFRKSKQEARNTLLLYVGVGLAFGLLLPVLAITAETIRRDGTFTLHGFWQGYTSVPLIMKIVGPVLLSVIGFTFGRLSLRRFRENALYTERLARHSEELKQRNASLTELNEALDNLVYTASHDLKTPVVNFRGLLNMLKTVKDRPGSEAMVNDIIGKLETSTDRFMDTITNLLDISRVESKVLEKPERIAIRELVEDILSDMQEQIKTSQARIEIETEAASQIYVSGQNLRSILQNLLSNAIKYSLPGRPPLVKVQSSIDQGQFCIRVSDNGQGIDLPANKDKLFQMFSRISDQVAGTGVGLYIVKRTMEKMGGDVSVSSVLGEGTTFQLHFPANCIP